LSSGPNRVRDGRKNRLLRTGDLYHYVPEDLDIVLVGLDIQILVAAMKATC